jgi:Ca-activated chloride channel homolog
MSRTLTTLSRLSCTALLVAGCGMADMGGGGEFGATQGGVQDMQFARELVARGQVPPPEAFLVEGMFSEHDLPLAGGTCQSLLCLRTASGAAPTLAGEPSAWLQVGMSSLIDPDEFVRPSLSVVAVVDVSGSMGWDYSRDEVDYPTPGCLARMLLTRIAGRLGEGDRIAIVTYGTDVSTALGWSPAEDQARVGAAIDDLGSNGSTNMEAGLRRAFELARQARAEGGTQEVRVMLFTDVQPNVGATSPSEFQAMAADAADQGVGLTVFALGVGMGAEVLEALVQLRGGNAFSLFEREDPDQLLGDSWPWLASPIAYSLRLRLVVEQGFRALEAYGFPGEPDGEFGLEAATVFLSRRKGAMLVRLGAAEGARWSDLRVRGELSYQTPEGETLTQAVEQGYPTAAPDERGMAFEQPGVEKAVALAILVSELRRAAEAYPQDPAGAAQLARQAAQRFAGDAAALADPALEPEVAFGQAVAGLMERRAPQGDLYGRY